MVKPYNGELQDGVNNQGESKMRGLCPPRFSGITLGMVGRVAGARGRGVPSKSTPRISQARSSMLM